MVVGRCAKATPAQRRWRIGSRRARPLWLSLAVCIAAIAASCVGPATTTAAQQGPTIYLVRHAEKAAIATDPPLSTAGQERAVALAQRLQSAAIGRIYSTHYRRTQQTAAPLAAQLNLTIRTYQPDDLAGLAAVLRNSSDSVLVVGHSNTTPELAAALGGNAGGAINEETEFDRLYVLRLQADGSVETTITRYGRSD